jgi:hypothetical protein
MIISGVIYTNTSNNLDTLNTKYETLKADKEEQEKTIYSSTDIKELKSSLSTVKQEYELLTTSHNEAVEIAKQYITERRNFYGSFENYKKAFLKSVKDIITTKYKKELKNTDFSAGVGNGVINENYHHTGDIISAFSSDSYESGMSNDEDADEKYQSEYVTDVYAKVKIDNSYTAICVVSLSKEFEENATWKVFNEEILADDLER